MIAIARGHLCVQFPTCKPFRQLDMPGEPWRQDIGLNAAYTSFVAADLVPFWQRVSRASLHSVSNLFT